MAYQNVITYDPTLYDYFNGGSSSSHHHYKPENLVCYQIENKRKELPKSVVKLIKLIFDRDEMEKYMKKNKLNSQQITHVIQNATTLTYWDVISFFNEGSITVNIINDVYLIRDACVIMSECSNDQNNYYHYYKKLNTKIRPLDDISSEYQNICKYVRNSHSPIHFDYTLEVKEIFRISKQGAYTKYREYKKLGNRKLLWHGSRITNFASILSKGLQIAPDNAPKTGSMFGNGIYFADCVSKSVNYCGTKERKRYGLLLLAEVALGKYKRWHKNRHDRPKLKELPYGYDSIKAHGKLVPDEGKAIFNKDNVEIPLGKLIQNTKYSRRDLKLKHNEYIVYNTDQFLLQYLVLVKIHYQN